MFEWLKDKFSKDKNKKPSPSQEANTEESLENPEDVLGDESKKSYEEKNHVEEDTARDNQSIRGDKEFGQEESATEKIGEESQEDHQELEDTTEVNHEEKLEEEEPEEVSTRRMEDDQAEIPETIDRREDVKVHEEALEQELDKVKLDENETLGLEDQVEEAIEVTEPPAADKDASTALDDKSKPDQVEESSLTGGPEKVEEPVEKKSFFQRLKDGLTKTRDDMNYKLNDVLGNYVKIDDDLLEELEYILISADIGMQTTMELIDRLKDRIRQDQVKDPKEVIPLLAEVMEGLLDESGLSTELDIEPGPAVILVVGVNGVGKTTTIGKLAHQLKGEGKQVILAAADTFRAAAIEQLQTWGQRTDTPVIAHREGADPAAVVFDAIQATKARGADVLICDTAGRLHNKANLMKELEKIHRVISKEFPEAKREQLLVLDATTGQNALIQAKTFKEVTELTGIVLTKLDGTAKGGVILPLQTELKIPIKYVGVGESIEDLQPFYSKDFSKALLGLDQ